VNQTSYQIEGDLKLIQFRVGDTCDMLIVDQTVQEKFWKEDCDLDCLKTFRT